MVEYVPGSLSIDIHRHDLIFFGRSVFGTPCLDPCPVDGFPLDYPCHSLALFPVPNTGRVVGETPVYVGEFQFAISMDAAEDHEIQVLCVAKDIGCATESTTLHANGSGVPFEGFRRIGPLFA